MELSFQDILRYTQRLGLTIAARIYLTNLAFSLSTHGHETYILFSNGVFIIYLQNGILFSMRVFIIYLQYEGSKVSMVKPIPKFFTRVE